MVKMFTSKMLVAVLVVGLAMPLAFSRTAAAGDGPSSSISVNPLGFIGWGPDVEFETLMGDAGALVVRGKFGSWSFGDWTNTMIGGGAGWRWYLNDGKTFDGLWIGPSVNYLSITAEYQDVDPVTSGIISFLVQFGYKWILGEGVGFVINPYLDLGYSSGEITTTDLLGNDQSLEVSGVAFGLGLAIGIAF